METGTEKVTVKAAAVRIGDVVHNVVGRAAAPSVVISTRVEQKPNVDLVHVHAWDMNARLAHALQMPAGADVIVERYRAPDPIMSDSELEQLVAVARDTLERDRASVNPVLAPGRRQALEALVDRLDPPQAPTLDEALEALARMVRDGAVGVPLNQAERLLRRARIVGFVPGSGDGVVVIAKGAA